MSSPAERADQIRAIANGEAPLWTTVKSSDDLARQPLLPPGSLVFHTRTEVIEWLRAEGLVVLDKQQAVLVASCLPDDAGEREGCGCDFCVSLALLSAGEGPK